MTETNPLFDEKSKKNPLQLSSRLKPIAEVATPHGLIYLYAPRAIDAINFEKLDSADATSQVRRLLTKIGSLTMESEEDTTRTPLPEEIANKLSNDTIEQIAEAYVTSYKWQADGDVSEGPKSVEQNPDEAASTYLLRQLKREGEHLHQSGKKLLESTYGFLDPVNARISNLSSTINRYDKFIELGKGALTGLRPIRTGPLDTFCSEASEQAQNLEDERAEKMMLTRLTGEMTAESAKTLKELAVAAKNMMEQIDLRDRKTDNSTRKQIKLAIYSVWISLIVLLVSVILGVTQYFLNSKNDTARDQRQEKLLSAIERGNQQHSTLEREKLVILEQLQAQGTRIAGLETTPKLTKSHATNQGAQ